jgi:hypothetical protein
VEKRLSYNFSSGASYTWSHALDEQSDIGLFFTGDDPNHLRNSWGSSDFDRTHVFSFDFEANLPDFAKAHTFESYVTNGWSLTGIGIAQSGEPNSLYEFYGAVGSINFGDYPLRMNPVLPIKNPKAVKAAMKGNPGSFRGSAGAYIQTIDPSQIAINYLAPGLDGIPTSSGTDPSARRRSRLGISATSSARPCRSGSISPSTRTSTRRTGSRCCTSSTCSTYSTPPAWMFRRTR